MLFFFFTFSLSFFANIDLGAQYVRIATIEGIGQPSLVTNREGSTITPNAVAFKTKTKTTERLTKEDMEGIEIKIGKSAVKYLKYNPETGLNYITRYLGRNSTEEWPLPEIAQPHELLALELKELLSVKDMIGLEGLTVSMAPYTTYKIREDVIKAIYSAHAPFLGVIDDFMGVIEMYAHKFHDRYQNDNHSVLFVDVGASHAACYRIDFYENATTIVANQTSFEWSEKTGTIAFAKAISEDLDVPLHKVMKMVEKSDFSQDIISQEIEELQRIILLAVGNFDIDAVQLIGGGGRLKFVEDAIFEATGVEIKKELPTGDATVLGGALMSQLIGTKNQWPVTIIRAPVYTSRVRCDNVSLTYCTRGAKCTDMVILDQCMCNHLMIEAEESQLPEGADKVLGDFVLTNISKFDKKGEDIFSGIIMLQDPMPIITSVHWCITSTLDCTPITGRQTEIPLKKYQKSFDYIDEIKNAELKVKRIINLKAKIRGLADELQLSAKENEQELVQSIVENALKVVDESNNLEELNDVVKQLNDKLHPETENEEL